VGVLEHEHPDTEGVDEPDEGAEQTVSGGCDIGQWLGRGRQLMSPLREDRPLCPGQ
jgi:hypothetical protein